MRQRSRIGDGEAFLPREARLTSQLLRKTAAFVGDRRRGAEISQVRVSRVSKHQGRMRWKARNVSSTGRGNGKQKNSKPDICQVVRDEEAAKAQGGDDKQGSVDARATGDGAIPQGRRCSLCGACTQQEVAEANRRHEGGLGRLLGPFSDRLGVAPVWVHQECAVWSPEVYFSGIGCLKNVRAALRRGRYLKCSRCLKPGATIGCRVSRCPRTFHLPCARLSDCSFDARRYLVSCAEHIHLFKKAASEAFWDDQIAKKNKRIAEEKAVDNAEDDEFVKRERKRLRRDLAELAPQNIGGSSSQGAALPEGWESVGGLDSVVQCLKEVVTLPLLYPGTFQRLGIIPPKGVLLYGHPGTGKTLAVRALLGACARGPQKIAYFARKGADCLGKYAGDSERQLRLLFQLAEQAQPSIIFFDEIDGLAPKRSKQQDQTQCSVVSTLLALMDGLNSRGSVVVIAATNRADALDPALRRPGRFDREIYFPLPSAADRKAILTVHTRKWSAPPSDAVLSTVSRLTPGFAGADLQALCTQAALLALKRVVPLQDLLKFSNPPPVLPETVVRAEDWRTALAQAPLPCSRRSLSSLSDVNASPLPYHLVPVLLKPLAEILKQLNSDGRLVLPAALKKPLLLLDLSDLDEAAVLQKVEDALCKAGVVSSMLDLPMETGDLWDVPDQQRLVNNGRNGSFRLLISGEQRQGQSLLAAAVLHVFQLYGQTFVLNLQTMTNFGCGEPCDGLVHILGEVMSTPALVYMPRVDSWALEDTRDMSEKQSVCTSSMLWKTFLQQVMSLPASRTPLMILATSEATLASLPVDVLQFFDGVPNAVPCACVQVPVVTKVQAVEMVKRASRVFSSFLEQRRHVETQRQTQRQIKSGHPSAHPSANFVEGLANSNEGEEETEKPASTMKQQAVADRTSRSATQDAIRSCGYQLLYCPQFRAVRQATSKLASGPSITLENLYTDTWVLQEPNKQVQSEEQQGTSTDDEQQPVTVRGVDAVGLKACKGFYHSASELVSDMKTVVELLLKEVEKKPRKGCSQWSFCQLVTQAASLHDLMESWQYELRRRENRNVIKKAVTFAARAVCKPGKERPVPGPVSSSGGEAESSSRGETDRVQAEQNRNGHKPREDWMQRLLLDVYNRSKTATVEELNDQIKEAAKMVLLDDDLRPGS